MIFALKCHLKKRNQAKGRVNAIITALMYKNQGIMRSTRNSA
jgi:hypothetical protein